MSEHKSPPPSARDLEELWPKDPRSIIQLCAHGVEHQGMRVGIFAAEVCQACGQIKIFDGWVGAVATHTGGQGFICLGCLNAEEERLHPGHIGIGSEAFRAIRDRLEQRPDRYCEICRERVPNEPPFQAEHHWLCDSCRALLQEQHPGMTTEQALRYLIRERYLWWTCRSMDDLRAFRVKLEVMRQAMANITREPDSEPV